MSQFSYPYPRPAVSVDSILLTWSDRQLRLLLIQRGREPFKEHWALPGGFVDADEDIDVAAARELAEETGLHDINLDQWRAYGTPQRDPRSHVITVVYFGMFAWHSQHAIAGDDAKEVSWYPLNQLPTLAFDHAEIIQSFLMNLRIKIRCQPIGYELLPQEFPLAELQRIYEAILNVNLDTHLFEKQVISLGHLRSLSEHPGHWAFDLDHYLRLANRGFSLDLDACQAKPW